MDWGRRRLRHRLEPKPAQPCIIIITLFSKLGLGSGELPNIWHYNFLRKHPQDRCPNYFTNRTLSDFPSQNSLNSTENTSPINLLTLIDLLSYIMNCVSSKKYKHAKDNILSLKTLPSNKELSILCNNQFTSRIS